MLVVNLNQIVFSIDSTAPKNDDNLQDDVILIETSPSSPGIEI